MFPYRRNGKKRGKGGPGGRPPGMDQNGPRIDPRRLPGSVRDVLTAMQPATKALAQMLAGNTRSSGQLAHARNILGQATRLIDERQLDRIPPLEREEFLEQYARLKLTVIDAEAGMEQAAAEQEQPAMRPPPVARERLREMALALATKPAAPPAAAPEPVAEVVEPEPVPEVAAEPAVAEEPEVEHAGPRRQRLRLKRTTDAAPDRRVEAS